MPTIAFGRKHVTFAARRFITKLTSRSLNHARVFAFVCAGMGMLLTGCGGGGGGDGSSNDNPGVTAGSAVKGPVIDGEVEITDINGRTVASLSTGKDSRFSVDLPEGAAYPLIVTIKGGTDLITGESPPAIRLRSAILHPNQRAVSANPFTTLIVAAAEHSDQGLSVESIRSAQSLFMQNPFGLRSELAANPLHTPINGQNVAELIRGSETLAKVLRRTSNTLGMPVNDVIETLAADLADGSINGQGAAGTDPEVAVVTNTAIAQTLVESLSGNLTVNGIRFDKKVLNTAAASMFPDKTSTEQTAAIEPTDALLEQAAIATEVALVVGEDARLTALGAALNAITASNDPEEEAILEALNVQGTTPKKASKAAGEATRSALTLSDDAIDRANAVVDDWRPDADAEDSPPGSNPVAETDSTPGNGPVADTDDSTPGSTPPTLKSIDVSDGSFVLKWDASSPTPDGGYDIFIDGADTGRQYRTTALSSTINGLDTATEHCFAVEARYTQTQLFPVSNQLCSTANTSEPPDEVADNATSIATWTRVNGATGYCLYHRDINLGQTKSFEGHPDDYRDAKGNDKKTVTLKCLAHDTVCPNGPGECQEDLGITARPNIDVFAITTLSRGDESVFSTEATPPE